MPRQTMVCGILRRSPLLQLLAILLPQFAANGPLASLSANKTAVIRVPRKVVDGWQLNQATVGEFEDPHAITRRTGTRGRSMTPVFCTVLSFIIAALFLKRARREKEGSVSCNISSFPQQQQSNCTYFSSSSASQAA